MRVYFLLFLALPFATATPVWETWTEKDIAHHLNTTLTEFLNPVADQDITSYLNLAPEVPHSPKASLYRIIESLVNGIFDGFQPIEIAEIGSPTGMLWVQNATLALKGGYLSMASPTPASYNLDPLTVAMQEISVTADHYVLKELDLGVVVISGEGSLGITLRGLNMQSKMDVKYVNLKLNVNKVYNLILDLDQVEFNLENLGGEGATLSNLLNSLVSDILPVIVKTVSSVLNSPEVWDGEIFSLLFSLVFNGLLCAAKPAGCS